MTEPVPVIKRDRDNSRTGRKASWESRFSRYAKNAEVTERDASFRAREAATSARYHRKAAANARDHGDLKGAALYDEMAEAALDAAAAFRDLADSATATARHYDELAEELQKE